MRKYGIHVLAAALCAALFIGGLGRTPIMFFDEEVYSECAREMLATGDLVVPRVDGEYFFDKPPLAYWLQAGSMSLLGVNSLGARLPSALAGVLLVFWTVFLGNRLFGKNAGFYAGFALTTSIMLVGASRMGIMDSLFSLTIALALGSFLLGYLKAAGAWAYVAFWASMGLSCLVKGPAGAILILAASGVFLLIRRDWAGIRRAAPLLGIAAFLAVSFPWYILVHKATDGAFTQEFIFHQNVARAMGKDFHHNSPWFTYIPLFVVGFFPWSVFVVRAWASHVRVRSGSDATGTAALFAAVWMASIIFIFSLSSSKLPGYIIPALPGSALLLGLMWSRIVESGKSGQLRVYAWIVCGLAVLVAVALQVGQRYLEEPIPGLNNAVLPMSLFLFAGPAAGALLISTRKPAAAFWAMCAGMAGFIGAASLVGMPIASRTMGDPMLAIASRAKAEARPGDSVVAYELNPSRPALAFYIGRPVPDVESGEVARAVSDSPRVLVVAQDDGVGGLPAGGRMLAREGDYVLLSYN